MRLQKQIVYNTLKKVVVQFRLNEIPSIESWIGLSLCDILQLISQQQKEVASGFLGHWLLRLICGVQQVHQCMLEAGYFVPGFTAQALLTSFRRVWATVVKLPSLGSTAGSL